MEIKMQLCNDNIDDLSLNVSKNIKRNILVCNKKGFKYAESLYKVNGYYNDLIKSLNKIIDYCDKALNNTVYCSSVTKPVILDTKKKALLQVKACTMRMDELKLSYNLCADIVSAINSLEG